MSKKKSEMDNIIKNINKDLEKLDMYRIGKSIESQKLNNSFNTDKKSEKGNSFLSFNSQNDANSINSNASNLSHMTYISKPFNEEKDLDLPYFTLTKYNSINWRLSHSISYFLYSFFLIISTIISITQKDSYNHYNIVMLIAHIFYFLSAFIQWNYFKRGCVTKYSNLNSKVKNNIDKSFKARFLRSEEGWKYFFSLFASIDLIYGNIYFFAFGNEKLEPEFWNINFIGCMIISLTQILKLEKILTKNKQYFVVNDLSNSLIEIFLFFGSLCFGAFYFIQIAYNYDINRFLYLFSTLKIGGNTLIIFSSLCLFHRYFCSNFDDLNVSSLSNVTI